MALLATLGLLAGGGREGHTQANRAIAWLTTGVVRQRVADTVGSSPGSDELNLCNDRHPCRRQDSNRVWPCLFPLEGERSTHSAILVRLPHWPNSGSSARPVTCVKRVSALVRHKNTQTNILT
jgi:hypothetical protein